MKKYEYVIELKDISISLNQEIILENFNIKIKSGKFVTLLGPSGCGKTTILKIIAGLLTPDSGDIFFDGENVTFLPPYKRNINTVFQRYALFPHLNVFDNIAFGLKIKNFAKNEIRKRVLNILKTVNLEGFEKRKPSELSGGQQQRIAIARALVNQPKVLLLDEPLSALDLNLRKEMQFELKEMQQNLNTTFIYVTHDQEEALTMSDTVVVMNEGEIQQIGTPQQIYNEPQNAFVADFIGQSNILNGTMIKDFKVCFVNQIFDCVDKGFEKDQPVDVVIRPEDIQIVKENEGMFDGIVDVVVFKGAHFEMEILARKIYWLVHTTKYYEKGKKVGLNFSPNDIHIMAKLFKQSTNILSATAVNQETVDFLNVKFKTNVNDLTPGAKVKIKIPPKSIKLVSSDSADLVLTLDSMIYKGLYNEMYFYYEYEDEEGYILVNSENEEEIGTKIGLKFDFDKIEVLKWKNEKFKIPTKRIKLVSVILQIHF